MAPSHEGPAVRIRLPPAERVRKPWVPLAILRWCREPSPRDLRRDLLADDLATRKAEGCLLEARRYGQPPTWLVGILCALFFIGLRRPRTVPTRYSYGWSAHRDCPIQLRHGRPSFPRLRYDNDAADALGRPRQLQKSPRLSLPATAKGPGRVK